MSDIDQYKHTCLGLIECPVPLYAPKIKYVAIYHLEQAVHETQDTFQGICKNTIDGMYKNDEHEGCINWNKCRFQFCHLCPRFVFHDEGIISR